MRYLLIVPLISSDITTLRVIWTKFNPTLERFNCRYDAITIITNTVTATSVIIFIIIIIIIIIIIAVIICIVIIKYYVIKTSPWYAGRLSLHRVHDLRLPDPWETVLHPWPDERRGPPLPPLTARGFLRDWSQILLLWDHTGPRAHAQQICRVSGSEGDISTTLFTFD